MGRYKMSEDSVPQWLIKLPPGDYTLTEICNKTLMGRHNTYMRLEALEVEKTYKYKGALKMNLYHWKGASYYWYRIYENRNQKIKKILESYGEAS